LIVEWQSLPSRKFDIRLIPSAILAKIMAR
jgi:hypothetical protein